MKKDGVRRRVLWGASVGVAFVVGYWMRPAIQAGGDGSGAGSAKSGSGTAGGYGADGPENGGDASAGSGGKGGGQKSDLALSGGGARTSAEKFRAALEEMNRVDRFRLVAESLIEMDAEDAEAALVVFDQEWREGKRYFREHWDLLRRLGELDGATALQARLAEGPDAVRRNQNRHIMEGWATKEPRQAAAWYDSLEKGPLKTELLVGLVDGLFQHSIEEGVKFMNTLPPETQRGNLRTLVWYQIQEGGFAKVDQWFEGLGANRSEGAESEEMSSYGRRAFDLLVERHLDNGHTEAARWIENHAASPYLSNDAVRRVAEQWSEGDGEEAINWVTSLPASDPAALARGVNIAMSNWAKSDPTAAGEWLGQQQDSPHYDIATVSFVTEVLEDNPEVAVEWASTIRNERQREDLLRRINDSRESVATE